MLQFTSAAFNYMDFMHRMSHYDLTLLTELQAGDKLEKQYGSSLSELYDTIVPTDHYEGVTSTKCPCIKIVL